jgi:hypothetical protein
MKAKESEQLLHFTIYSKKNKKWQQTYDKIIINGIVYLNDLKQHNISLLCLTFFISHCKSKGFFYYHTSTDVDDILLFSYP